MYQPANSPSGKTMECLFQLQAGLDQINDSLNRKYLSIDRSHGTIPVYKRAYGIPPANAAHENEGVLVIHGFAATPNESKSVGVAVSAAGYPAVMGLLPGFGSSTKVANAFGKEDWKQSVANYVDLMSLCFKKIHLVGFSIGGGLVSNFMLSRPDVSEKGIFRSHRGDVEIRSVSLLSPYYETGSAAMDWMASELRDRFGLQGISIELLYNAMMWMNMPGAANDLKALDHFPSTFNSELPLEAAEQVRLLGEDLRSIDSDRRSEVPVFLSYSGRDQTMNPRAAHDFVKEHFAAFDPKRDELVFPAIEGVPHQITFHAWNPDLDVLLKRILVRMAQNWF